MRPVDDSALRIGFKFAVEFHRIAGLQAGHSGRNIDVVGDQKCLARGKAKYKPLMPAAIVVVRQDAHHRTAAARLCASDKIRLSLVVLRRGGRRGDYCRIVDRNCFFESKEDDGQGQ